MKIISKYRNIEISKRPFRARIYLDYAATTPVDPLVFAAMQPYFSQKFGNPGSVHSFGQEAIAAVDGSRETIARAIGAEFREVIFTGSATEANNFALRGTINAIRKMRITSELSKKNNSGHSDIFAPTSSRVLDEIGIDSDRVRIIVSSIEHESILETARELEKDDIEVVYLPVDKKGIINIRALRESLNDRTVLVSIMYANNEIGSIQPIEEIGKIISKYRNSELSKSRNLEISKYPLFHTDAVQAFQFLDCDVKKLGVDMMTFSAHKIYGPKGIGALYMGQRLAMSNRQLVPIITGGGQEFGFRSGTENVPLVVGFAKAMERAITLRKKESERIAKLRDHLWWGIKDIYPKAELNGATNLHFLPNLLNVYFPGHEAQDILTRLDLQGIAVSSGSACRSRALEASYVITALGYSKARAGSSIRFSLGRPTTKSEINRALVALKKSL